MSVTQTKMTVEEIAQALRNNTGSLGLEVMEARLLIATMRRLANGKPVQDEEVAEIAAKQGLPFDQASAMLGWVSERDADGPIMGLAGHTNWSFKAIRFPRGVLSTRSTFPVYSKKPRACSRPILRPKR